MIYDEGFSLGAFQGVQVNVRKEREFYDEEVENWKVPLDFWISGAGQERFERRPIFDLEKKRVVDELAQKIVEAFSSAS